MLSRVWAQGVGVCVEGDGGGWRGVEVRMGEEGGRLRSWSRLRFADAVADAMGGEEGAPLDTEGAVVRPATGAQRCAAQQRYDVVDGRVWTRSWGDSVCVCPVTREAAESECDGRRGGKETGASASQAAHTQDGLRDEQHRGAGQAMGERAAQWGQSSGTISEGRRSGGRGWSRWWRRWWRERVR